MAEPCWGKSPRLGVCPNPATRFFISLVARTPGCTPQDRAVCEGCCKAFRFDLSVNAGIIKEVPAWRRPLRFDREPPL